MDFEKLDLVYDESFIKRIETNYFEQLEESTGLIYNPEVDNMPKKLLDMHVHFLNNMSKYKRIADKFVYQGNKISYAHLLILLKNSGETELITKIKDIFGWFKI